MKKGSVGRSLIACALGVILCVMMLLGTTYAWFTDAATSGVNRIQAGNLDLELLDGDGKSLEGRSLVWQKATGHEEEAILWEPGSTYSLETFTVKNQGDLALKYEIRLTGLEGNAKLLEVLEFTIGTDPNDPSTMQPLSGFSDTLQAGGAATLTISGKMKDDAGTKYQGLTISKVGITVRASQCNSESDSFGPDYDAPASEYTLPEGGELSRSKVVVIDSNGETKGYETLKQALLQATENSVVTLVADGLKIEENDPIIEVGASVFTLNLNGKTLIGKAALTFVKKAESSVDPDPEPLEPALLPVTVTVRNGTYVQVGTEDGSVSAGPISAADGSHITFVNMTFKASGEACLCTAVSVKANHVPETVQPQAEPAAVTGELLNTYRFTDCVFENATVKFDGENDTENRYHVIFDGCSFTASVTTEAAGVSLIEMCGASYGALTVMNTEMEYSILEKEEEEEASTEVVNPAPEVTIPMGYCISVATVLTDTDGAVAALNMNLQDVTLSAAGYCEPFMIRFLNPGDASSVNAVVTATGTNHFTIDGKSANPGTQQSPEVEEAIIWTVETE